MEETSMSIRLQYYLSLAVIGILVVFLLQPTHTHSPQQTQSIEVLKPIVVSQRSETVPLPEPDIDSAELECLAKNIYFEARGESWEGKLAVAYVTMNRVHSQKFPDTVCEVVHQAVYSKWWFDNHNRLVPVRNQCQFSWYCDGKSDNIRLTTSDGKLIKANVDAWQQSQAVATSVLLGDHNDNTKGATYYYNPQLADPAWQYQMAQTTIVGGHRFMRPY